MVNDAALRAGLGASVLAGLVLVLVAAAPGAAQPARHATGTFEVKLTPQGADDKADGNTLGRMSVEKQIHGDLEGTSKAEMLSAMSNVKGSGTYVAIERVTGTLEGRRGTFVLAHQGTMNRGAQKLEVTVVPDSGTGDLVGLAGRMTITIAPDGKHSYAFEYTLPEKP